MARKNRNVWLKAAAAAGVGAIPVAMWAYSSGPPPGITTAPTDAPGVACTLCHSGTPLNGGGGNVQLSFSNGSTYTPGQTQTITITVNDSSAVDWGFQLTARLDSDAKTGAGSFTAQSGQGVLCADGGVTSSTTCPDFQLADGTTAHNLQWIEHLGQPFKSNVIRVQWTAPPANVGNVHFYVAANAANGDFSQFGDHIYAADSVLTGANAPPPPVIAPSGVVNAGSGAAAIESGSFVSIYGRNFAAAPMPWDSAIRNGILPTTLGGVSVAINGKPAPVAFVSSGQINALAPADTATGPVQVTVTNAGGTSVPVAVQLRNSSPAFFLFGPGGNQYIAAQIALAGGKVETLAPVGLFGSGVPSRPAKPGEVIVLYGTGFGPLRDPLDTTRLLLAPIPTAQSLKATIGGQQAQVLFSGMTEIGLYQINVAAPATGLSNGDQPVVVTLPDGTQTAQNAFVAVQQ